MLTGPWTFYWGNEDDPDEIEGEFVLNAWDMISLPPGMYRSFEYTGDEYRLDLSLCSRRMRFSRAKIHTGLRRSRLHAVGDWLRGG